MKRAFVVVLDACGVGELPDAAAYGDAGSSTLAHVAELAGPGGLKVPTLARLGLGNIVPILGLKPAAKPGIHGRLSAIGPGKDSTAGHWALMGVASQEPLPVYPDGFPDEVIAIVSAAAGGRGVICNRAHNGLDAIDDFGAEQLRSGALIVYTSQDSVLQIAAHVDVITSAELYRVCEQVRAALPAAHAVGRVIARPFTGEPGAFVRTPDRKDFAIDPPARSYLDALHERGVPVHTVGKAGALFAGRGVDVEHPGVANAQALDTTTTLLEQFEHGFVFTNLIETDQLYGHRHDVAGFAGALTEIDRAVRIWLRRLRPDDLLILTADHGVDPKAQHTDHTREYVPLLAVTGADGAAMATGGTPAVGFRHDGPMADVGATVLRWLTGRADAAIPGTAFL